MRPAEVKILAKLALQKAAALNAVTCDGLLFIAPRVPVYRAQRRALKSFSFDGSRRHFGLSSGRYAKSEGMQEGRPFALHYRFVLARNESNAHGASKGLREIGY
jgi:hypothetical protein